MKLFADLLTDDRVNLQRASRCGPLAVKTSNDNRGSRDYRDWSIEELRALASQLQLPDAACKTRSELLRLFDASGA
jgi:hypothetical protein